ncbi:hypothetical protein LSH36_51g07054 [Paralvinella palmiformis]|uniref:Uncharacterized protein n=1 Tax=Paralvinella palmiformis TaxID=53620 RepID=A0AAD9K624_9ANNE|nr:hypothetical protein LSH36_51g07054 [Paralvinella palmiformis]
MDKVSKEIEATKSRNDLETETPSSDEKSSRRKHTEQFEVESGDVYARVSKYECNPEGYRFPMLQIFVGYFGWSRKNL